jgi:acetolactate synthase I/II/III large subunit
MTTLGEALIALLEAYDVDTVFGIPGVHTIELYRGLAQSKIRHITPRHEQGAAFMADGYARVSGKPGVALLITGPGVTNAITPMGQARADSIPMLVISGVNQTATLGKGFGYLHELPDQRGMMEKVALFSERVTDVEGLAKALARAFAIFETRRSGPVHIEIPLDAMGSTADDTAAAPVLAFAPTPNPASIAAAAALASGASRPLIIAGGGAKRAEAPLRALAEKLDAPVVLTINGRGLMHRHPLLVPASPSLWATRKLMADADLVIGVGTEFGQTDFDLNAVGGFEIPANLVRIDIDAEQLARRPATVAIQGDSNEVLTALSAGLAQRGGSEGAKRAETARQAAYQEIGAEMQAQLRVVETIRDTLPGSIIVGDSTQPVYAANLYYDHDRPGGWFNGSCGFGALGYGPPAAIGAALAAPDVPVVSLSGDGGFQFTLPELGAAVDAKAPVIFVVWNNSGYREIETSMRGAGVEPVGVSPAPPDFVKIAEAYGIAAERLGDVSGLGAALRAARVANAPFLIEITVA